MKYFSKLAALLLGAALIFGFAGCADPVTNTDKTDSDYTLPAPKNVSVTESAIINNVTVSCDAIDYAPEHRYLFYYSTTNDTSSIKDDANVVYSFAIENGRVSRDISLPENGTYYFWVKAYDGNKSSDFSEVSSPFTFTSVVGLDAPTNVKAAVSTKTVSAVTVTWDAINCDKVHYYWIYCSTKNDTSSLKEPNYLFLSSSIKDGIGSCDIILSESGTYYFWVKAASGGYNSSSSIWGYNSSSLISSDFSEASNPVAFTFALDAPTNVKAALSSEQLNTVTLTWDAIDCDIGHFYWIYCSTKNDTSSLKEPNYLFHSSFIKDGIGSYDVVLSESGTYYFWVKAAPSHYLLSTTSSAFSKVSNSVSFTHQDDLPVPTDLRASLPIEADSIILHWTSTKAPYYHIYMNTENNSETATLYSSYSTSNYAVVHASELTSGTTYYFWVKSADTSSSDSLTSGFSNVASYTWSE